MAGENGAAPATKADLHALETRIEQRFEQRLTQLEQKLIEEMRDMQTELLRGFAAHFDGLNIRMRLINLEGQAKGL